MIASAAGRTPGGAMETRPDHAVPARSNAVKLSFVTSLYRSGAHLEQFLAAMKLMLERLAADAVPAEAVVIANEPDLYERRLLARAVAEQGERVRAVAVPRETLYASWNRGVAMAEGEAVAFWNTDDLRNPEAILEALSLFSEEQQLVLFPYVLRQRGASLAGSVTRAEFLDAETLRRLDPRRDFQIGPFFVCTKRLLVATEGFDEQFRIVGDYEWQIRAAAVTRFAVGTCIGGQFESDRRNLSSSGSAHHRVEQNLIFERHDLGERLWALSPEQEELRRAYRAEFQPALAARLAEATPLDSIARGITRTLRDTGLRGCGRIAFRVVRRAVSIVRRRSLRARMESPGARRADVPAKGQPWVE